MKVKHIDICHRPGWFGEGLGYALYYPLVVWVGFFMAGKLFRSPLLLYVSYFVGSVTWLLTWGTRELLVIPRPPQQICDRSYVVPDVAMVFGMVNVITVGGSAFAVRRNVSFVLCALLIALTALYNFSLVYNYYMSFLQWMINAGIAIALSGFFVIFYAVVAHPLLEFFKFSEGTYLGEDVLVLESPSDRKKIILV